MPELHFDGRVAIVTGAGGGLGREHAKLLAARGARVVVNDVGGALDGTGTSTTPGDETAAAIRAAGGDAVVDANSVATRDGGEAIVQTALDAFGRVDIVVNNAGILRDKAFHNLTDDLVEAVLDVHLRGAFNVTRPAWRLMREQQFGRVVNTTSNAGLLGNFGQANYAAAKTGLVGLTNVLAIEGARYGIKVNAIAPVARTRMTEELFAGISELGPEQVAPVVALLAHDDCPVSGHVYSVAGGRVARFFVGLTHGFVDGALTPESVRDHLDEIEDRTGYVVLDSAGAELQVLLDALR